MKPSTLSLALALLSIGLLSGARAAGQTTPGPVAPPLPVAETGKVDINTAEISALEAIPEIGTAHANAVVAARPFKSVDDLDRVLKIGPEKINGLRGKLTASVVKPTAPPAPNSNPAGVSKPSTINDGKATDRKEVGERYDRAADRPAAEKSAPKK